MSTATLRVVSARNWDTASVRMEKIRDLILNWRLYPRKQVDQVVVQNYARALRAGANFPPVKIGILDGSKIIVDGVHRIKSRQLLQIDYVECAILQFDSEPDLFAEAVRFNSAHGKGFCEAELKANIRRLQRYKFDVNDIVTICHVPASEITRETSTRITMEMTKPITSIRLPNGNRVLCADIKPGEAGVDGLICLKSALIVVCNWAESSKIPADPPFKELVFRARMALGKVRFNA